MLGEEVCTRGQLTSAESVQISIEDSPTLEVKQCTVLYYIRYMHFIYFINPARG